MRIVFALEMSMPLSMMVVATSTSYDPSMNRAMMSSSSFAFHLAMANADAGVWYQALNHAGHFLDVAHAVVDEVGLAASADFVGDGVADDLFVEARDDGVHGMPVGWRRAG